MSDREREPDSVPGGVFGERRSLLNLAFRMLGSSYDAEDVVQETYVRWCTLSEAEQRDINSPTGWLVRVASRICLDHLASARVRREHYVGEWLPEPLPDRPGWGNTARQEFEADPADHVTLDESVSMGVLVVLDSVTPAERVAFVLHDVFGVPFAEIAETVGRTPAACRQLATSARRRIRASRPHTVRTHQHERVVSAFKHACETGDMDTLIGLLDPDATVYADGGGKVRTALRPISGAEKVARLFLGVRRKHAGVEVTEEHVGGRPGLVSRLDGTTVAVMATEIKNGSLAQIWLMMNPDKLHAWNNSAPKKIPPDEE
jgi:RNA polymerase sigma factor (sigma-70 family)